MHKAQVDAYVVENQQRLRNFCFKLCRGSSIWEDLFQEFYLAMLKLEPHYFERYPMKKLCSLIMVRCYLDRDHNKALKPVNYVELQDIFYNEPDEYVKDLHEYIEKELNRPHGFAPVMVFMQSLDESLRSIEKKTGINHVALWNYKKQGQAKLRELLK